MQKHLLKESRIIELILKIASCSQGKIVMEYSADLFIATGCNIPGFELLGEVI